jgi:RNA polymerase sigma-70 factor (ECF subfamily)
MDERPDEVLVSEARQGSAEAFAELARRCQQRIYRVVYGMTRSHQDADDLCQEVFLTAFRSMRGFRQQSSFYTWVYRIAVNLSLNFLKKRDREGAKAGYDENLGDGRADANPVSSPEGDSIRGELRVKMREAVDSLPALFKASFLLVTDQGLSHAEAARALGCSENTVSWRMHKARKMLRARLRPYLDRSGS